MDLHLGQKLTVVEYHEEFVSISIVGQGFPGFKDGRNFDAQIV
jgi:uncharacterized protein (DUF934 family)